MASLGRWPAPGTCEFSPSLFSSLASGTLPPSALPKVLHSMRKFTSLAMKSASLAMRKLTIRAKKFVTKEEGAMRVEYGLDGRPDLHCGRAAVGH